MGLPSLFENIIDKNNLTHSSELYYKRLKSGQKESLRIAHLNRCPTPKRYHAITNSTNRRTLEYGCRTKVYSLGFYKDRYFLILSYHTQYTFNAIGENGNIAYLPKSKTQIVPLESIQGTSKFEYFCRIKELHSHGKIVLAGNNIKMIKNIKPSKKNVSRSQMNKKHHFPVVKKNDHSIRSYRKSLGSL